MTDKYVKTMMARGLRNVETTTCRAPTRMVEPNRCGEGIIYRGPVNQWIKFPSVSIDYF